MSNIVVTYKSIRYTELYWHTVIQTSLLQISEYQPESDVTEEQGCPDSSHAHVPFIPHEVAHTWAQVRSRDGRARAVFEGSLSSVHVTDWHEDESGSGYEQPPRRALVLRPAAKIINRSSPA